MGTPRYTHTPPAGSGGSRQRRRGQAEQSMRRALCAAWVSSADAGANNAGTVSKGQPSAPSLQRSAPSAQPPAPGPSPRPPAPSAQRPICMCQRTCVHPQLGGNLFEDLPLRVELRLWLLAVPAGRWHTGDPCSGHIGEQTSLPQLLQLCLQLDGRIAHVRAAGHASAPASAGIMPSLACSLAHPAKVMRSPTAAPSGGLTGSTAS
jgi:hypothetical protein